MLGRRGARVTFTIDFLADIEPEIDDAKGLLAVGECP